MSHKLKVLLWVLLLVLSGGLFYHQLSSGLTIETNILKLLPKTEADPFAEEAFKRFSEQNFKQIVIAIKSPATIDTKPLALELVKQLQQSQLIERFNSQLDSEGQQAVAELIFQHRFHLLSQADQLTLQQQGARPLIEATEQVIYSPLSGQLLHLIPGDPLLLSYRYLQQSLTNGLSLPEGAYFDDNLLVVANHQQQLIILSAVLEKSPFDTQSQQTISKLINNFRQQHPELELLTTGALFYAQHAASSAKSEISTIGLGSLLGVIVLLILAFRSSLPLVMTISSLAVGVFLAFSVVHFYFGSIHILTLVFGASLVGVAVDYAFHYFTSAIDHSRPLPHIFNAIRMGLISSVIGYAALYLAPFPGLQQMAVFCASGLTGAFLTVTLLFDTLRYKVSAPAPLLSLLDGHKRASQTLARTPLLVSLLFLPLIAGYLLLSTDPRNDNIRQLQAAPAYLIEQEQTLSQVMSAPATNQFFLLRANNNEQLLQRLHHFDASFRQLVNQDALGGYQHLAQYVPSQEQQRLNYQLIGQQLNSDVLQPLLDIGILDEQRVKALQSHYQSAVSNYLDLTAWLQSPIGRRLGYLWLGEINGQVATIVSLNHIKDMASLEQLAEHTPDLYFINKVDKVSQLFFDYRQLATQMLLLAVGLIFILLAVKYCMAIACYVLFAPILGASVAIILTILISGSFNLFSTLALFLVVGIGIDYGLFYAETKSRSVYIHLAVSLSAATTFLSFGLLSLSETPAIHAFGLTMLTGILTVFLLSPILGHRIYLHKGFQHE